MTLHAIACDRASVVRSDSLTVQPPSRASADGGAAKASTGRAGQAAVLPRRPQTPVCRSEPLEKCENLCARGHTSLTCMLRAARAAAAGLWWAPCRGSLRRPSLPLFQRSPRAWRRRSGSKSTRPPMPSLEVSGIRTQRGASLDHGAGRVSEREVQCRRPVQTLAENKPPASQFAF